MLGAARLSRRFIHASTTTLRNASSFRVRTLFTTTSAFLPGPSAASSKDRNSDAAPLTHTPRVTVPKAPWPSRGPATSCSSVSVNVAFSLAANTGPRRYVSKNPATTDGLAVR